MVDTFIDTCVLLDVIYEDSEWFEWSSTQLARASDAGRLVINAVVYAGLPLGYQRIEQVEDLVRDESFDFRPISKEAAFLAAKAYGTYRRRGGSSTLPLSDFFIGAHASILGLPLLTRDRARFQTYFPKLKLIRPS